MVLRRRDMPVQVLRYLDLVADPRSVIADLLAEVGLDAEPIGGTFIDERGEPGREPPHGRQPAQASAAYRPHRRGPSPEPPHPDGPMPTQQ
jgi:hypothetical protein